MRTVLKIAKNELYQLFFSPIAWLLLIIFLIQAGVAYFDVLEALIRIQSSGSQSSRITTTLFNGDYSTLGKILHSCYWYVPLLTMGLIGKEMATGTMKLLLSSPVKVHWIVWGKYLAITCFNLLLTAIAAIFVMITSFSVDFPDHGLMYTGLLGLFLLLSAFGAIGLFISSLSEYQIVAALGTLILFAILSYAGSVWQYIDFVRDLTYYLSIQTRVQNFLEGLISSKDLLYYFFIILLFIGFTIIRLRKLIVPASNLVQFARYASLLAIVLVAGYFSSRPGWIKYFDNTATNKWTLSPEIQQLLADMNKAPLNVTCYVNLLDHSFSKGRPESRIGELEKWESYQWFKPDIHINYVYYYDSVLEDDWFYKNYQGKSNQEIAASRAKSYRMDIDLVKKPAEIRQIADLRPELNSYVMQLEYMGSKTFLRTFNDLAFYPSVAETGAALKRIIKKNFPVVAFLEGHYERNVKVKGDRGYSRLAGEIKTRNSLMNQGFDICSINLDSSELSNEVDVLVIADPRSEITGNQMEKLRSFIAGGGNLLICGEPGKQKILNELLGQAGVQMMDGQMVQQDTDAAPDYLTVPLTDTALQIYAPLGVYKRAGIKVSLPGVAPLSPLQNSTFQSVPLLFNTSAESWYTKNNLVTDSAAARFAPEKGDLRVSLPLVATLVRPAGNKEQRIAVVGDADFLSNIEVSRLHPLRSNFMLGTGLLSWLSYGEYPVRLSSIPDRDKNITISENTFQVLYYLVLFVTPALLVLAASLLLIRRRQK